MTDDEYETHIDNVIIALTQQEIRSADGLAARIVSRCSGPSVIRRRMVCFGGSSVATAAFVRRTMTGRMRVASWRRRTGAPSFSIGVRKRRVKFFRDGGRTQHGAQGATG